MSLSFVSSAVLSSSDGVSHNEEKTIENREVQAVRARGNLQKPLFEQLRDNQQKAEDAEAEFQKSIVRGTLALNEEDAAHLDALRKQKEQQQQEKQSRIEQELALFRAAKADRAEGQVVVVETQEEEEQEQPEESKEISPPQNSTRKQKRPQPMPKITVVRKRRRQQKEEPKQEDQKASQPPSKSQNDQQQQQQQQQDSGLGGLLGGYGSDDSD